MAVGEVRPLATPAWKPVSIERTAAAVRARGGTAGASSCWGWAAGALRVLRTSGVGLSLSTDAGRQDVLTAGFPDSFTSLTGHTENSESVGPAVTVLATGPTCPIQFVRTGEQVWATQFHSDMDAVAMRARMDYYYDYGYFSPDDYDAIVAELPNIDTTWSNRLLRNFVAYCAGDLS